ncbi:MAG: hypothetical protein Q9220_004121 [cf. Caloplaca sp. 1 TL-2023]
MPAIILPAPTTDQIDDLLYLARTNDLSEFKTTISLLAQEHNASITDIGKVTIDPDTGNGILHMAAGNGCMDVLDFVFSAQDSTTPHTAPSLNPNLQNLAGNTPLHYAALNQQLSAIKCLVAAGADPGVKNRAGHDSIFEAERKEWVEGVEYLLKAAGAGEGHGNGEKDSKPDNMDGPKSIEVEEDDTSEDNVSPEEAVGHKKLKTKRSGNILGGIADLKIEEHGR